MEVILLESFNRLGKIGDIVKLKMVLQKLPYSQKKLLEQTKKIKFISLKLNKI